PRVASSSESAVPSTASPLRPEPRTATDGLDRALRWGRVPSGKGLRADESRRRRARRRPRRMGAGDGVLAELAAPLPARRGRADRRGDAAPGRARGRVRRRSPRHRRARRRRAVADHAPAPRRRGAELLRRGGAAHRLQDHQGGQGADPGRPALAPALPHRLPPPRLGIARAAGRHRHDVGLVAGRRIDRRRAGDRPRRPHARQRHRRHSGRPPLRGRHRERHRVRARKQGPREARGVLRGSTPGVKSFFATPRSSTAMKDLTPSVEHRFGPYGGQYVPETLMPALAELEREWLAARDDPAFGDELAWLLRDYAGRPTPLYRARRLSEAAGAPVYFKREDLLHTGAHKLNNALGQSLLAQRMGKTRVIA